MLLFEEIEYSEFSPNFLALTGFGKNWSINRF